jgi:hypothetical protein
MAAVNILTIGTNQTPSSDFTVTEGATATLSIKPRVQGSMVVVEIKDDTGGYSEFKQLGYHNSPLLIGGGTFRVKRVTSNVSVGVFRG